jgi:hypothetical protein
VSEIDDAVAKMDACRQALQEAMEDVLRMPEGEVLTVPATESELREFRKAFAVLLGADDLHVQGLETDQSEAIISGLRRLFVLFDATIAATVRVNELLRASQ